MDGVGTLKVGCPALIKGTATLLTEVLIWFWDSWHDEEIPSSPDHGLLPK